jgi:hypothetical protein
VTIAIAMILVGAMLIYMGIKSYSIADAIQGRRLVKSQKPQAAR